MRHALAGSLFAVLVALGLAACSPPTAEEACKAAAERFTACGDAWGEKQIGICKANFAATTTMKDYTKTLKKCSEMKECDLAKQCMMTILVAVGEDSQKSKKPGASGSGW